MKEIYVYTEFGQKYSEEKGIFCRKAGEEATVFGESLTKYFQKAWEKRGFVKKVEAEE